MSSIVRSKKGAWFLGICKGLEISERGSAFFWRLVFFIAACFTFGFAILVYLGLAIIFPYEKKEKNKIILKNNLDRNSKKT